MVIQRSPASPANAPAGGPSSSAGGSHLAGVAASGVGAENAGDVLDDDELGLQLSDGSVELGPEVALTISSFSFACQREVRTGEASAQNVDRLYLAPVNLTDVAVDGQSRPLLSEHSPAGRVDLYLPDDLPQADHFAGEVQAADP